MFDSLYPEAADAALDIQARRPPDAPPPTPWFKGAWSAIGKAVPRAGAEMGRAAGTLLTPEAVGAVDAPTMFSAPGKTSKPQLAEEIKQQDTALRDAIKDMTPDAQTTGAASMILHDVTRFVGKAAAYSAVGGLPGAVAGVGLDEGTNEALKRMDEGVDPATAAKLGVVHGVASAAAVAVPVAGRTIAQTVGLAAAGGPGSFIGEQAAARKILETNGYQEEADRIDPFDPLGLGVSFLGPLLFGAGAHAVRGMNAKVEAKAADARMLANPEPPGQQTKLAQAIEQTYTREQVDAARVTDLQAHREAQALHAREDVVAGAAHERALDRATEQIAAGQRVSVADVAPVDAVRMGEAVREPVNRLLQEANPITREMAARIDNDFRGAVDEYSRLEGTDGGRILNTDEARELSPAYRKNRTLSADVHEPASAFVKRLYAEKLAQPTPAGRDPVVLFTAGGTGAGKSTGLTLLHGAAERAEIIYDTNMNGLASSDAKIQQALAAGRQVQILYTYRDPVDALKNGALPRAMRMGRTVPLREHARTHQGAADTVRALAEKYAGDERVSIEAVDNSRGKGGARLVSLDELPKADYTDIEAKLHEALDQEYAAGRISEKVRAGTAGAAAGPEPQGALGADRSGVRGQLEQADSGQAALKPEAVDAYLDAQVAHIEATTPDILVQLEGMDAPMRASELLAQVREEAKLAIADAPLVKIAAECALMG